VAVWATQEETELATGANFAGYRIEGVAGAGRMGVVYRATHPGLGRVVALKLIARELTDDYAFRRRFRVESQRAAAIGLIAHPGAALVYERGESAGRLFLVMRYVAGADLGALVERHGALEPDRAVAIVADAAAVLDAAHRRGIFHGDVKPGHVLLADGAGGSASRACLIDFGLTPVGTPARDYLAPERITGEPASVRADVYSLSCVLLHALTGRAPSPLTAMPAGMPPALRAVIARAMSKAPLDRYTSAGELARAAAAALSREAPPMPPATERAPRRRRWPPADPDERGPLARWPRIALAAALLAALVAALLAATGGVDGTEDEPKPAAAAQRRAAGPATAAPNIVASIPVGRSADGIAFADGEVWVADPRGKALVRIDARTDRVTARVRGGGDPDSVAAGDGVAWLTSRGDGRLRRFDARAKPSPAGALDVGAKPEGIALGRKLAWVVSSVDDTVTRVDRSSGARVGRPTRVGAQPIDVAVGRSGVWTANSADGTVTRIDAGSGRAVGDAIRVGREPKGVTEGLGSVWVANGADDTVSRIDPRTSRVIDTVRVGDQPSKLAVAAGLVWVTNFGDGTVSRIDPVSGRVVGSAVRVGRRPVGIAFGAGHVWVASLGDGTVTKLRP
jgi:YVTN family beta-propeller protein